MRPSHASPETEISAAFLEIPFGNHSRTMKKIGILIIGILLGINSLGAGASKDVIIRKPGHYSLDAKGNELTITKGETGSFSLTVRWHSGNAGSSSTSSTSQSLEDGWFVYVESSNRIWVFDGVDQGILLTHSEKESGSKAYPRAALRDCPPKFWDALPQALRTKYPRAESAGTQDGKAAK
jgi:hypothetical protein